MIGVDSKKMLYLHLETVEDIFEAIEEIVTKVRESDKNRLVTILVDSVAGASTKFEIEADFDKMDMRHTRQSSYLKHFVRLLK